MARVNYDYLTYEPLKVNLGAAPDWMFNSKWSTFEDAAKEVAGTQVAQAKAQAAEQQIADAKKEQQVIESLKAKYSDSATPLNLDQLLTDYGGAAAKLGDFKTAISAASQLRQYQKSLADAERAMQPKAQRFANGSQWVIDPMTGEAKFIPGPEKPAQPRAAHSRMMIFDTPEGGKVVGNLYDKTTQDKVASGEYLPPKPATQDIFGLLQQSQPEQPQDEGKGSLDQISSYFGGAQAAKTNERQQPSGDPIGTIKKGRDGKTYVKTAQGYAPQ